MVLVPSIMPWRSSCNGNTEGTVFAAYAGEGPRVPHEPQRADRRAVSVFLLYPVRTKTSRNHSAQCRFGGATGFNVQQFSEADPSFCACGHSCEQRILTLLPVTPARCAERGWHKKKLR
jgi:hypothetical protein